jgi:hypothetical protein
MSGSRSNQRRISGGCVEDHPAGSSRADAEVGSRPVMAVEATSVPMVIQGDPGRTVEGRRDRFAAW